jgi:hypothetical protein
VALTEIDVRCKHSGTQFRAMPTRSFLGFQKVKCPSCSEQTLYPLTRGYRITYIVVAVFMAFAFLAAIRRGGVPIPGILGVAAIVGLVKDAQIRRQLGSPSDSNSK